MLARVVINILNSKISLSPLPCKLIAEACIILSRLFAMWLWGNFCKDQKNGLVSFENDNIKFRIKHIIE